MIETPVKPLITTYVVLIGRAKIRTLTKMRAEHIYVVPRTMNPRRKFVIELTGMVLVTVMSRVKRLIVSMPIASKHVASTTSVAKFAFLFTYAIPMIVESEIAPIHTPVSIANTKLE